MRYKQISIAVIDDGINNRSFSIGELSFNIEIDKNLNITNMNRQVPDSVTHGTKCAAIIKKYAEKSVIGSIKILDSKRKRAVKHQLIEALIWCARNNIKLVNLSLGTIDFRDFDEMKTCINEVASQGVIIVAACNNKNVYTVPACFTNVIGVRCRKIYLHDQYTYNIYPFDGVEISASGRHMLTDVSSNEMYTPPSNSFAAPLITAMVYKYLVNYPDISLEDIKRKLYEDALNYKFNNYNPYICLSADWVNNCNYISIDSDKIRPFGNADHNTNADTIVLSNFNNKENNSYKLLENFKHIENKKTNFIFLSSNNNNELEHFENLEGMKMWHTDLYRKYITNLSDKHCDIDVPVVALYDLREARTEEMHTRLNMLFREQGYYSVLISTCSNDIISGCEFLPPDINPDIFISKVYTKYRCDIVLLYIDNIDSYKNLKADIVAYISDSQYSRSISVIPEQNDCKFVHFTCSEDERTGKIEKIYKSILDCFDE